MAEEEKKTRGRRKAVTILATQEQLLNSERLVSDALQDDPDVFNLPESKYTPETLVDFLTKAAAGSQRILPKEKRRYVMYLRKSTDDEAKQVRSLEDQEKECRDLAKRLGISVRPEDVFIESASAKKSGNRPIFDRMLRGFQAGKYQGLLAWSPDRLSRNMKEAGEIIEMIDNEDIQDLHFRTYQFDNSPNGKMLLGILFATSKQYSDKLAVDVSRGITGAISDGKYVGQHKRGYFVDSSGRFVPDINNWRLMRRAVNMRLKDGKTNQDVADFLNAANFSYRKSEDEEYRLVKMDKKTVSAMFNDPFYCGVYKHGDNIANLNDQYDFLPLITTDEYIALSQNMANSFGEQFTGRANVAKRLDFGLLREKVICDYCNRTMQFQRTRITKGKNKGSWLLMFYCRNKQECIRHNPTKSMELYGKKLPKSIRMKYVTAHIEWTLRHLTKNTLKAHKLYVGRLEQKIAVDKEIAKRKLTDAKAKLKQNEEIYARYQNLQLLNMDEYKRHHKGKLEHYQNLIAVNTASIDNITREITKLNAALPTREEFVKLVHSYLETVLNTRDLIEEDAVYQEVVSNLRVKDNAVSVIKLNPPYDMMVDLSENSSWSG